ncbi:uncharacterized protein Z518_05684 [Rhinocladiella mackenziei CBS 650.93]|uniref:NAD(P)-binding domain-containing protein n=1 Tax=Rhinocladiella mackenziei CBS 650.93 TaxID=1442369 RepID=A0A0D2H304_9EURO|nr:uncharacterized protein Z518_05684 [Rhinocladiella mackenziei CBS 650.93]KIX04813.1 hypothetical protein Z518_05684 [Rhinocladiella mackenziei CBS 650.93]
MKVVLTGSTGFIGGEVLNQCIAHPRIASIVVLSRRELSGPAAASTKTKIVILKDFLNYPEEVLSELQDADICIWSLGTYRGKQDVEVGYPIAFCNAISRVQNEASDTPFRFVYLSGMLAITNQDESVHFLSSPRKAKGMAETKILARPEERGGTKRSWETYVVRPGYVLSKERGGMITAIFGNASMLRVDELAAAMIEVALNGHPERRLFHPTLVKEVAEYHRNFMKPRYRRS